MGSATGMLIEPSFFFSKKKILHVRVLPTIGLV